MNCPRSSTAILESTFFAAKSAKISALCPLRQKRILTNSSSPQSSPASMGHESVSRDREMVVFPIDKAPLVCGRVLREWGFLFWLRSVSLAPISHPRPVRLLGAFHCSPSSVISHSPIIAPLQARTGVLPQNWEPACRRCRLRCGTERLVSEQAW
jgi:hypothetical protein